MGSEGQVPAELAGGTQLEIRIGDGGVAILTMNAPPVNALTRLLSDELTRALDIISELDQIRAVILTGTGRAFCAGADLKGRAAVVKGPGDLTEHLRRTRECFHAVRECVKPVVAAVNGYALGAGLALVASCDILLASEDAALGLPEIDVGLMGGTAHARRLLPHSALRRMALTGHRLRGPELYRRGIVEACTAPDDLMPRALEIAASIAAKSPVSARLAKRTLNLTEDMSLRDAYRHEQEMTVAISRTDDAAEARRAFLEKRPPVFTGR